MATWKPLSYLSIFAILVAINLWHLTEGRGVPPLDQIEFLNQDSTNQAIVDALRNDNRTLQTCTMNSCIRAFYLWTREFEDGKTPEPLLIRVNKTLEYNHLVPGHKTYVIVHGYLGHGLEDWIIDIKDGLLKKEDCNVISVDWLAGNNYIEYSWAVGNVPVVGADIALFFTKLNQLKGLKFDVIHMVGHSLGAHACGFAAKNLQGKIKRITGLDPAGPDFRHVEPSGRLDKSDAEFVDIVHTNACVKTGPLWFVDCYGIEFNLGHADFWPGGGQHQPACAKANERDLEGLIFKEGNKTFLNNTAINLLGNETMLNYGCSHIMAYKYYLDSIGFGTNDTFYLARTCNSWDNFAHGHCNCSYRPQYMAYNCNTRTKGIFFLNVSSSIPYGEQDDGCPAGQHIDIASTVIISSATAAIFFVCLVVAVVRAECSGNGLGSGDNSGFITKEEVAGYDNPIIEEETEDDTESSNQSVSSPTKSEYLNNSKERDSQPKELS